MAQVRELVPSLSPAQNTTACVPVCAAVGVQAKVEMSGVVPVAPTNAAPAGRPAAHRRVSSTLGSVAVTARWTALLQATTMELESGEKSRAGGSGAAPP